MRKPKESSISKGLITALNKLPGCKVKKRLGSIGNSGEPDITGTQLIGPESMGLGLRIEIEVKRPGQKPTAKQFSKIDFYTRTGAISFWCDSIETGLALYQDILNQKIKLIRTDLILYDCIK